MMTIERAVEIEPTVPEVAVSRRSRRDEPVAPAARLSPAWSWRTEPTFADNVMGLSLLAGPANVIMQLARPGVGYGVKDSTVESGRIDRHPIKRTRTTVTYLAVAAWGSPQQKAAYRKAVNRSHAPVHSAPGDAVQYNAFDPELQKWVAACLYKGFTDVYRAFVGPLEGEDAERCLREGAALGTTLQMPLEAWPATCDEFEQYWEQAMDAVHIDEPVRRYLYRITSATVATPRFLRPLTAPFARLMTTGFLPQRFRDEMQLPWSSTHERIFRALVSVLGGLNRLLPNGLRRFPYNAAMVDLNWRIRTGRPLV